LFTVERVEGKDSAIFENKMSLPDLADWARKKAAQA
jgi:hypothetical protein